MRIELGSFVLSDEVSLSRPRDGNKRLAEKSHKIFRVLFEFYRASISRD